MRSNSPTDVVEGIVERTIEVPVIDSDHHDWLVPLSIAYVHTLVSKGLGDHYDWNGREFRVTINDADRRRERGLVGVEEITLRYVKGGFGGHE